MIPGATHVNGTLVAVINLLCRLFTRPLFETTRLWLLPLHDPFFILFCIVRPIVCVRLWSGRRQQMTAAYRFLYILDRSLSLSAKRTACYPTGGWRIALIKNAGAETVCTSIAGAPEQRVKGAPPPPRCPAHQSQGARDRAASIIKKRAQPAEEDEKEF